jgi:hypothetical protein
LSRFDLDIRSRAESTIQLPWAWTARPGAIPTLEDDSLRSIIKKRHVAVLLGAAAAVTLGVAQGFAAPAPGAEAANPRDPPTARPPPPRSSTWS